MRQQRGIIISRKSSRCSRNGSNLKERIPVKQITIESDQTRALFSSCSLSPNKNSVNVIKKIGGTVAGFKSSKPY